MRKSGITRQDIKERYIERSGALYALGALKLPATPSEDVADHYAKYKDIDRTASVKKVSRLTVMLSLPDENEEALVESLAMEGLTAETISSLTGLDAKMGNKVKEPSDEILGMLVGAGTVERYSLSVHAGIKVPYWDTDDEGSGLTGERLVAGLFDKGIDHYWWHYGSDLDVEDDRAFLTGITKASFKFKNEKRVMVPWRTARWMNKKYGLDTVNLSFHRALVRWPANKKLGS